MKHYFLALRAGLYYVFLALTAVFFTLAIFLAWPLPFQSERETVGEHVERQKATLNSQQNRSPR